MGNFGIRHVGVHSGKTQSATAGRPARVSSATEVASGLDPHDRFEASDELAHPYGRSLGDRLTGAGSTFVNNIRVTTQGASVAGQMFGDAIGGGPAGTAVILMHATVGAVVGTSTAPVVAALDLLGDGSLGEQLGQQSGAAVREYSQGGSNPLMHPALGLNPLSPYTPQGQIWRR